MPFLPNIAVPEQTRIATDAFLGYDHRLKIAQNAWYDMKNLSADAYPMLSPRRPRGTVCAVTDPAGVFAKDALGYVDGAKVVYNGLEIDLGLSAQESRQPKQLVSMGAYLVIFPDKKYLNTADLTDYGSLDASFTSNGTVSYTMCTASGEALAATVSDTAPQDPANGAHWIDTSGETHALMVWSETAALWTEVPACYVKLSCSGIGAPFREGDGVIISGCAGSAQLEALNKTCVIQKLGRDELVIPGLLDQAFQQESGAVTLRRQAPEMDFVCEAQNRLWGCKYGMVDGKPVNELYCCKLGDFKNWNVFSGLSTDSWAASVGSDGSFTGCVNYLGYPTFFKENCLHRVAVASSGGHQVTETRCRGVQKGSGRSLQVVGETLYYKARDGVCAYQGALPVSISDALGGLRYSEAAAGAFGQKYYISMKDEAGRWQLFCYDTGRGLWMREDETHALMFAACDDELYYLDAETGRLMAVNGTRGAAGEPVAWEAVSGLLHDNYIDRKYVGRYNLRVQLPPGSSLSLAVQYDSDGVWRPAGTVAGTGTGTFTLPVIPRRCDHLRLKLMGTGEFRLFSIARILEQGSDR